MEGVKKIFDKNTFSIHIRGKKIFYWLSNTIYTAGEVAACFWWRHHPVLLCVDNSPMGRWLPSLSVARR